MESSLPRSSWSLVLHRGCDFITGTTWHHLEKPLERAGETQNHKTPLLWVLPGGSGAGTNPTGVSEMAP